MKHIQSQQVHYLVSFMQIFSLILKLKNIHMAPFWQVLLLYNKLLFNKHVALTYGKLH